MTACLFSFCVGLEFCVGKSLDDNFLHVIRDEVQALSGSLPDLLKCEFDKIQARFCEVIRGGHEKTLMSQELEPRASGSFSENLEVEAPVMPSCGDKLISRDYSGFAVNCQSEVFDAPDRNKWFTGRQREIESLERCLALENSAQKVSMAAICGLGGCGKTTLAAHFAWEHKPEYEGGVFWLSMEDEKKFDSCVNDLALRLGLMADSIDRTLSKILSVISHEKKRWLVVLDNVDQPQLSDNMRKVLLGRWKRESNGHMIITTRRERKEICQWMDLEPHCCVEVFSFSTQEAKTFLLNRAGGDNAAGQENKLHELVVELGCLPLALEQAGAHIRSLQCPLSKYLEQYNLERLQLLSEHQANPSWEYESRSRLSVHTTWLLNFEYVKNSKYGEIATIFVHAAAFFDPDEIHEGLINALLLSRFVPDGKKNDLPLTNSHIVDVLTKFSLFQRKSVGCIRLHRVVQEVIRASMKPEEIAKAMCTSFQLLKNAALPGSESATDTSVFSIIRHWLSLKRHMAYYLLHFRHTLDVSLAGELNKLLEEGAHEIVSAVSHTLEKSKQTFENYRRLSALVDGDKDKYLGERDQVVKRKERKSHSNPERFLYTTDTFSSPESDVRRPEHNTLRCVII